MVGVVHGHLRRRDQQQPVAGQQGRRPDDDLREIARGHRQGRQHGPGRRRRLRRAGQGQGLRRHGHAGLRSGEHDRHRRRRGQRPRLHDGPRLVFGCKPAPSIKVATNTPMYEHMIDDMDIDAGVILDGDARRGRRPADFRGDSRRRQRQEDQERDDGVGEEEFAPWAIGPTLSPEGIMIQKAIRLAATVDDRGRVELALPLAARVRASKSWYWLRKRRRLRILCKRQVRAPIFGIILWMMRIGTKFRQCAIVRIPTSALSSNCKTLGTAYPTVYTA